MSTALPAHPTSQPLPFHCPLQGQFSPHQLLPVFKRLIQAPALLAGLPAQPRGFYNRLFSPLVILWYLIFQRLHADHTLQAVVTDVHSGGGDALAARSRPLSQRIHSLATTAYSDARQRLPLSLLRHALQIQAQQILALAKSVQWRGWYVELLDGSTVRLRPDKQICKHFPPHRTQNKNAYWCLMRVAVCFCLRTGTVLACQVGGLSVSEQVLASHLILSAIPHSLFIGDRNFGVFRIVQTARHAVAQVLLRMTKARARKVAAGKLRVGQQSRVLWAPSRHDQLQPECSCKPIAGRLLVVRVHRKGYRSQVLYLFTTLLDEQAYPLEELVQLYGGRWQIELNLRYLKSQMELKELSCKSAEMAKKEWFAGLLAYNLIRAAMLCAALDAGLEPQLLSFSAARRQVQRWLQTYGQNRRGALKSFENLLLRVGRCRHPKRKKSRPSEPRAKRHLRAPYPPLWGSRTLARKQIKKYATKY